MATMNVTRICRTKCDLQLDPFIKSLPARLVEVWEHAQREEHSVADDAGNPSSHSECAAHHRIGRKICPSRGPTLRTHRYPLRRQGWGAPEVLHGDDIFWHKFDTEVRRGVWNELHSPSVLDKRLDALVCCDHGDIDKCGINVVRLAGQISQQCRTLPQSERALCKHVSVCGHDLDGDSIRKLLIQVFRIRVGTCWNCGEKIVTTETTVTIRVLTRDITIIPLTNYTTM